MNTKTVNEQLDDLARRYDAGEFRGPGEYLAKVTEITSGQPEEDWLDSQQQLCGSCGHVKDHEACNGRVE